MDAIYHKNEEGLKYLIQLHALDSLTNDQVSFFQFSKLLRNSISGLIDCGVSSHYRAKNVFNSIWNQAAS